jgi:purine-cytosine permease-like protein
MIGRIVQFFGDAIHTRLRWRIFIAILFAIVIADFLVKRGHGVFFFDDFPGWGAVFGFLACTAIIFVSKFIGHQGGIMRDEDYYD